MSGLRVPPLRGQWNDDVPDAIALTEAVLRDDLDGASAVLRNMDAGPVAMVLAKLLAETVECGERGFPACRCHFREWSLLAVRRAQ